MVLASQGSVPVAEIQFADYIFPAFESKLWMKRRNGVIVLGGQFSCGTLRFRTAFGGGIAGGLYHSQSPEAFFAPWYRA